MNFNKIVQGEKLHGNYRLRQEPVESTIKVVPVLDAPGTEEWENEGGACAPPPYEISLRERYKTEVRVRGPRKQQAARMFVPKESIRIVKTAEPVDHKVAIARLEDKTVEQVEVDELKRKIEQMAELVRRQQAKETAEEESVRKLQEKFEIRRIR